MSYLQFVAFTFAGAYVWSALLIGVGFELGHAWWRMGDFVKQFAPWLLAVLVALGCLGLMTRWLVAQRQRRSALVPVTNVDEEGGPP